MLVVIHYPVGVGVVSCILVVCLCLSLSGGLEGVVGQLFGLSGDFMVIAFYLLWLRAGI